MFSVPKYLEREKRLIRMLSQAGAHQIVFNSLASARRHAAVSPGSTRAGAIPNGFDTNLFRPDEAAWQRVRAELGLHVDGLLVERGARVRPIKSHANFLRTAGFFATTFPKAPSVLAGGAGNADHPALSGLISALARPAVHHQTLLPAGGRRPACRPPCSNTSLILKG